MPKLNFCFANLLRVGHQARTVKGGHGPCYDKLMGNTASCKFTTPKIAQLERAVDQFVVVLGLIHPKALLVHFNGWQAGGYLPSGASDRAKREAVWLRFLAMHTQAQAGAIEETALSV